MRDPLASRVAASFRARLAGAVILPFKPAGPTLTIGGRKYVKSNFFPGVSDLEDVKETPGGARLIQVDKEPRFSWLWVLDTERKILKCWRISDGSDKADGTMNQLSRELHVLEKRKQLNRVTTQEMRTIERFMDNATEEAIRDGQRIYQEAVGDWGVTCKALAQELFDTKFLPKLQAKFREIDSGVIPLGFKVTPERLPQRSEKDQAKIWVAGNLLKAFDWKTMEAFAATRLDLSNVPGSLQDLDWARSDVINEFYDSYFPRNF